ncbi:MAG: DEAD/DEAH box helicase [Candidatus Helarchaeales archaeon]
MQKGKNKKKSFHVEVKKPPTKITFIPSDSILEPFPRDIKIETQQVDEAKRIFKNYVLEGIKWADEQRKNGNPRARFPSETACVNNIRLDVLKWRKRGYSGTTDTTQYLLHSWFEQHREKKFWFAQREAIEALIYIHEVKKIRTISQLIEDFSAFKMSIPVEHDKYPRYAFRMATGTGKTLVMAMLAAWSFFNYLFEDNDKYSRFFLFVAPNLIVYDRLRKDLENLRIWEEFQVVPTEWLDKFKIRVITRDSFSDRDRFPPPEDEGVVFVSNIHQLGYKKLKREKKDLLSQFLGIPNPGKDPYKATSLKLWEILHEYPNLMILKDEAHHVHRKESKWQKYIWNLHETIMLKHQKGISMELDFSATPKNEDGTPFPWIITDYSLREALQAGIIKYPARVVIPNAPPVRKDSTIDDFTPYLNVALERWRKHEAKLKELGKKSVLFIMSDEISTAEAICEKLLNEPDINSSNMMLIHSELDSWKSKIKIKNKEITSKIRINGEEKEIDKELAIELVRKIDEPDNPIKIISSVMMLNEGWDVRSVTVILGLRSFTSRREILPEQVIGRGLRKLFPKQGVDLEKGVNILEVVGPPKLLEILNTLEQLEGVIIPEARLQFFITFTPRKNVSPDMKINIPDGDNMSIIDEVNPQIIQEIFSGLPKKSFKTSELRDFIKERALEKTEKSPPFLNKHVMEDNTLNTPIYELIKLATELEKEIPMPNSFGTLLHCLNAHVRNYLFDEKIILNDEILNFLHSKNWFSTVKTKILNLARTIIEKPRFTTRIKIERFIETEKLTGFPWTKKFIDSDKSLLARVVKENDIEKEIPSVPVNDEIEANFANFLTKSPRVKSFLKNIPNVVRLGITHYYSRERKWLKFYPDFIVRTEEACYLIEIIKREEDQVKEKIEAVMRWCKNTSNALKESWKYLRVKEGEWMGKNDLKELVN